MGRRVVVISAAVLLAVIGVVAVVLYANGADERAVAAAQPRTVFVSTRAVPAGTPLTAAVTGGLIVQTSLPAKAVPQGSLSAVTDENKDLVAVTDIAPGEYIQSARFGTTPQGSQVIRVPSGQIAMAITLSDPARVGTFIAPGSHIVLFTTETIAAGSGGSSGSQTRVLFADVPVIAVGSTALSPAQPNDDATADKNNASGALVTLALKPEQAQELVQALQTGSLYAGLLGANVTINTALLVREAGVSRP